MTKRILIAVLLTFALTLQSFGFVALADVLPIRAFATDTVAGYASSLKSSRMTPGQKVVFVVEKPDGSVVKIPAEANVEGLAETELFGHQTKLAGVYRVALVYPGSPAASPQSNFNVFADTVSSTQSSVTVTSALVKADGVEKTFARVTLFDAYRNPIKGHLVKMISSRGEDKIEALSGGVTNDQGQANFAIASPYPGISVLTALDSTLNTILTDRKEVVFQAPSSLPKGIGGNLLGANLLDTEGAESSDVVSGPVDHFEIEDLAATVKVGEELNLTVVAKDKNGNTAKNYTGTILISVPDDENASLPGNGEYTFKESNQGKFTFNLALQFSKLGKQTVQIFDKENWRITGEKSVEVVSSETVSANPASNLVIKSPADGAELGNSFVIISGQGDPNINLKIFDDDIKIGDSETDGDGFFSFEAKNLQSGLHTFYAMSEKGEVSASINVQIDTLPPVVNSFEMFPEGTVTPGESLSIHVQSEPGLETAKIRLQGIEEKLTESAGEPGNYTAIVAAPVTEGRFALDVILVDKLGNKSELLNQALFNVAPVKTAGPAQVSGLTGIADDRTVTLTWEPIKNPETPIQHYRIYYGNHFDRLSQKADTKDAVSTFTFTELENDMQYFFAVVAVDSKGNESGDKSLTVALTPKAPEAETVPEMAPAGDYQAYPLNSAADLRWPAYTGGQAYYYKIYFGIKSGQYDDFVVTPNNGTQFVIKDLINELPYYFSVVALDISGQEISTLSPEFSAVPGVFHGSAPVVSQNGAANYNLQNVPSNGKTGSEAIWIILFSLFGAHFLYHQKKRLVG